MSDFLDNLIARSLSRIETVRPQVISIFEPPPLNGGAIFHESAASELPIVEHEMENPMAERLGQVQSLWRGKTEHGAMAAKPLFPAAITPWSLAAPSNVPVETPPPAVTRKRAAVAPAVVAKVPDSNPPNEYNSLENNVPLRESATTSPAAAELEKKPADARPKIIEEGITGTIVRKRHLEEEATPAREAQTSQLRPAAAKASVPAQQPTVSPVSPIVPASIAVSPHVLSALPHDEGASETPSIYVTIGRVEVRATMPPPIRLRPQAAPAPVMTLDKYLRQRAAGDRR